MSTAKSYFKHVPLQPAIIQAGPGQQFFAAGGSLRLDMATASSQEQLDEWQVQASLAQPEIKQKEPSIDLTGGGSEAKSSSGSGIKPEQKAPKPIAGASKSIASQGSGSVQTEVIPWQNQPQVDPSVKPGTLDESFFHLIRNLAGRAGGSLAAFWSMDGVKTMCDQSDQKMALQRSTFETTWWKAVTPVAQAAIAAAMDAIHSVENKVAKTMTLLNIVDTRDLHNVFCALASNEAYRSQLMRVVTTKPHETALRFSSAMGVIVKNIENAKESFRRIEKRGERFVLPLT